MVSSSFSVENVNRKGLEAVDSAPPPLTFSVWSSGLWCIPRHEWRYNCRTVAFRPPDAREAWPDRRQIRDKALEQVGPLSRQHADGEASEAQAAAGLVCTQSIYCPMQICLPNIPDIREDRAHPDDHRRGEDTPYSARVNRDGGPRDDDGDADPGDDQMTRRGSLAKRPCTRTRRRSAGSPPSAARGIRMDESSPPISKSMQSVVFPEDLNRARWGFSAVSPFSARPRGASGWVRTVSSRGGRLFTQRDEASPGIAGGHLG